MDIRKVGVVGAGQMGNGIAHVMAMAGYDVMLNDISQDAIDNGLGTIRRNTRVIPMLPSVIGWNSTFLLLKRITRSFCCRKTDHHRMFSPLKLEDQSEMSLNFSPL